MSDTATDQARQIDQALGLEMIEVPIGDKTVEVRPLKLKQFSEVLKCVNELAQAGVVVGNNFDALQLIAQGGDVAMKLISIASGFPIADVEDLELDEAAEVAGAIWRVNNSFFEKKAATMLAAFGMSEAKAQEFLNGMKSSLSSLPAATQSETSPTTPSVKSEAS